MAHKQLSIFPLACGSTALALMPIGLAAVPPGWVDRLSGATPMDGDSSLTWLVAIALCAGAAGPAILKRAARCRTLREMGGG